MKHKYKILIIASLVLLFILIVLPYLLPISHNISKASVQSLVTTSGRFLNTGSGSIYVEEQGPVSGEAILLIHGFGGSTFTWRNNAPFLANQGYRVIALDMKGFGLSGRDYRSDYSHEAQAEIIEEVLQQLKVQKAYIIGHSMGSSVMFHLARLYPEKVPGMISVDGAINLKASSPLPAVLLGFPPFQRAGRDFLTRYMNRERLKSILESAYYRQEMVTSEVIDGYYDRAIRSGWDESLLAMTRDMPENMIDFPLESLLCPTLIVRGENDTWVSQKDLDLWKDKIPGAVFKIIPNSGHLPMEEQPDIFNDIVIEFMRSVHNKN